ncbi:PopZ family protein [Agrobacterium rosae]|uniref:PopZ family protein n=1 Tax=Agrobacterium rosae TaxID=1972867 RepID=UPI003BA11C4F
MAQPNVAREPSMEEILASIRRIIESNEPASGDAFSAPLPPVYDEEEEATSSFAAELASPPAHVPPAANQAYGARQQYEPQAAPRGDMAGADAAEKTMSLADVAARVRAAADRNAALGPQGLAAQRLVETPSATQPTFQQERPQRPNDLRPLLNVAPPAPVRQPQQAPAPAQPVAELQSRPLPGWEGLELRGAVEPEQSAPAPAPVPVEAQPEIVAEQPALPTQEAPAQQDNSLSLNLISAAAGAQIAQSFGELAEMFDGVERPTVEQMAQDMLRPMLQDWLEDNLPTLVERLVREEIERVARGPRR